MSSGKHLGTDYAIVETVFLIFFVQTQNYNSNDCYAIALAVELTVLTNY